MLTPLDLAQTLEQAMSMSRPKAPQKSRVVGWLESKEERSLLERAVRDAPELVCSGRASLLVHADRHPELAAEANKERQHKLEALKRGRLARYVFLLETHGGARLVKICEVQRLGNGLLGLLGRSVSRTEHANHRRAERLELAATHSVGFLELRRGPVLVRSCQVQTLLRPQLAPLDGFLARERAAHGDTALLSLAEAIAEMHKKRFFHADLKGFHSYVDEVRRAGGAARYRLLWIDLARVSFHLSPRQRVINLYQAIRYLLPHRADAHELFLRHYCALTGWHADHPDRALRKVRGFLAHKYETHPVLLT